MVQKVQGLKEIIRLLESQTIPLQQKGVVVLMSKLQELPANCVLRRVNLPFSSQAIEMEVLVVQDWQVVAVILNTEDNSLMAIMSKHVRPISPRLQDRIDSLGMSTRATNALEAAKLVTLEHLIQYTREDLLKIRSLGPTTLREIIHVLSKHDLFLKGDEAKK